MNYECFTICFQELCSSFDIDYGKKKDREKMYFNSKLGTLGDSELKEIIKKARETLTVKQGYLPAIQQLLSIHYNNIAKKESPINQNKENYNQAKCIICDSTGYVIIIGPDGYTTVACCTCEKGQNKQDSTILGRNSGCYKNYLERGYELYIHKSKEEGNGLIFENIAYEAVKEEIPF